jgi:ribosomal protein S19
MRRIVDNELINDWEKARSKATGMLLEMLSRRGRILPFMVARCSKDSIRVF